MKKIIIGVLLMSPIAVYAQAVAPSGPLGNTLNTISGIVNFLIPLLLAIAVLVFFWGLIKYIASANDETAKENGKTLMIWGMIALFVMVAFWGIIGFVQQSLGISGTVTSTPAPSVGNLIPRS